MFWKVFWWQVPKSKKSENLKLMAWQRDGGILAEKLDGRQKPDITTKVTLRFAGTSSDPVTSCLHS